MKRTLTVLVLPWGMLTAFLVQTQLAQGQEGEKLPAEGVWKIRWDGKIDGVLRNPEGPLQIKLSVRNNRITGSLTGDDTRWSGEVSGGKVVIVTLTQQGKKGYVSYYSGKLIKEG